MSDNFKKYKDNFDIQDAYVPKETRELKLDDVDNFNLKLNKVVRRGEEDSNMRFKFFNKSKNGNYLIKENFGNLNFNDICKKQINNIKAMKVESRSFVFSPDWRMVVGLGGVSVYETSITLDHIYGFPIIPGQALKGVCRNHAINYIYGDEQTAIDDENETFIKIFGCEDKEGSIIFYDVLPMNTPKIEPDIMNPHYSGYYSSDGKKPPADYYNPNIIPFLTVRDTKFQFVLGLKKGEEVKILDTAVEWMKDALTRTGIGAKTSQGYGYMEDDEKPQLASKASLEALQKKFNN